MVNKKNLIIIIMGLILIIQVALIICYIVDQDWDNSNVPIQYIPTYGLSHPFANMFISEMNLIGIHINSDPIMWESSGLC